jgi:hypothetical protein
MKRLVGIVSFLLLTAAVIFGQDFKKDEVLCAAGETPADLTYHLAKVLKAASSATKNQAQVLYVMSGSKEWADFVIPTHPTKKEELADGVAVFYPSGWAEYDTLNSNDYRSADWKVGHVTSLDEMFKNFVEIDGAKYTWKLVRMPNDPAIFESAGE